MRDKIFAPSCRIQLSAYPADLTREGEICGDYIPYMLHTRADILINCVGNYFVFCR